MHHVAAVLRGSQGFIIDDGADLLGQFVPLVVGEEIGAHRVQFAGGAVALVFEGQIGAALQNLEGLVGPVETRYAQVGVDAQVGRQADALDAAGIEFAGTLDEGLRRGK